MTWKCNHAELSPPEPLASCPFCAERSIAAALHYTASRPNLAFIVEPIDRARHAPVEEDRHDRR